MKRIDIQANGGAGLLFNSIKNVDEFIKIELNHLVYGKTFIIPTFITDSNENLRRFVGIVLERISLGEKKYRGIILPKLWGIHIEGPFITNRGTHPEKHIKEFNERNVNEIIEILKPLSNLPIYFTLAPELVSDNIELLKKLKKELNVTIAAGHTKITREEFEKLQKKLGEDKIMMLTHLHNAMLEGHYSGDVEGIPTYVDNGEYEGFFGLIADGQHTAKGELLPLLLNHADKICLVSDSAAPACSKITDQNNLYEMGGSIGVVEQKLGELPCFFWTDFSKNPSEKVKDATVGELYEMYLKGEGGYKTLAGSAVNLDQCIYFLRNLDIEGEVKKSKSREKTEKLLGQVGDRDIKNLIEDNIEKMAFDNPVRALDLDGDIYNYEIMDDGLYKNGKLFVDFSGDVGGVLESTYPNQDELRKRLLNHLKKEY